MVRVYSCPAKLCLCIQIVLNFLHIGQYTAASGFMVCSRLPGTFLGLYPIVLAVNIWDPLWRNPCTLFSTDNEALTTITNRQTTTHIDIMKLLADSLSRQRVDKVKELSPQNSPTPTLVPLQLQPIKCFQHCLDYYSSY